MFWVKNHYHFIPPCIHCYVCSSMDSFSQNHPIRTRHSTSFFLRYFLQRLRQKTELNIISFTLFTEGNLMYQDFRQPNLSLTNQSKVTSIYVVYESTRLSLTNDQCGLGFFLFFSLFLSSSLLLQFLPLLTEEFYLQ